MYVVWIVNDGTVILKSLKQSVRTRLRSYWRFIKSCLMHCHLEMLHAVS